MVLSRSLSQVTLVLVAAVLAATIGCSGDESKTGATSSGGATGGAGGGTGGDGAAAGTGGAGGVVDDGLHPVLSNFRVEDAHLDRVYFDSSEPITAATVAGFVVSGRNVTAVHAEPAATTGHYFVVESDFTFWDNTMVRYEGGADLQDLQGSELYPFTLRYVENHIPEPPSTGAVYYVDSAVTISGDGSSEAQAFKTINEAASIATAGATIWVEAGDYGAEQVVFQHSGTATAPIRLIGYQSTVGDSPVLERSIGMAFDSGQMPLLSGTGSGVGITTDGQYTIIRNVQVEGYTDLIMAQSRDMLFSVLHNVYLRDGTYGIYVNDDDSQNVRVQNAYVADCVDIGIRLQNKHNLIDDVWAVSSKVVHEDYYLVIYGGPEGEGNIVRNSYVHRFADDSHTGHGISLKAGPGPLEHNLIENCEILNSQNGSIELRHSGTRYNVVRGIWAHTDHGDHDNYNTQGINFENGTSHNIVESSEIACKTAFTFTENEEDGSDTQPGGTDNTIVNTLVHDSRYVIGAYTPTVNTNNRWVHCTFHSTDYLVTQLWNTTTNMLDDTNELSNCIVSGIPEKIYAGNPDPVFANGSFHQSWTAGEGPGALSLDPQFVDAAGGDFTPQNSGLKAGTPITGVEYDREGTERAALPTIGTIEI